MKWLAQLHRAPNPLMHFQDDTKRHLPSFCDSFSPKFHCPLFSLRKHSAKKRCLFLSKSIAAQHQREEEASGSAKKKERKKAKLPLRRNERTFRSAAVDSCVFAQIWATTTTDVSQRSRTNIRPDYCSRRLFIIIAESGIHGQNQQSFPFQIVSQWDFLGDRPALNPPKLFLLLE